MRTSISICIIISLISISLQSAFAQNADPASEEVAEQTTESKDILPADAVLLGKTEENGVLAMAYLYKTPTSELVDTGNQAYPYLIFVRFIGVENNITIEKGLVAYKIEDSSEKRTPATRMELKSGYFVTALETPGRGYFILHIGTKLEDDHKRQYTFNLRIK